MLLYSTVESPGWGDKSWIDGGGGGMIQVLDGVGLGGIGGSGVIIVVESKFNVSSTSMTLISDTFTDKFNINYRIRIVVFDRIDDGLSDFSFSDAKR